MIFFLIFPYVFCEQRGEIRVELGFLVKKILNTFFPPKLY